jgi:hypothetical protein
VHRSHGPHVMAAVPAKTAHRNRRAYASFILTQMLFAVMSPAPIALFPLP